MLHYHDGSAPSASSSKYKQPVKKDLYHTAKKAGLADFIKAFGLTSKVIIPSNTHCVRKLRKMLYKLENTSCAQILQSSLKTLLQILLVENFLKEKMSFLQGVR